MRFKLSSAWSAKARKALASINQTWTPDVSCISLRPFCFLLHLTIDVNYIDVDGLILAD